MNEVMGQEEKALSNAAELVGSARGDVTKLCGTMSDRVADMMTGWRGSGAGAFSTLMITWNERQEAILKALDGLAAALVETEKDNLATDEAERAAHAGLQARLG
jgi:WXG100 family type VII secretion target